jgi:hypothetical protein
LTLRSVDILLIGIECARRNTRLRQTQSDAMLTPPFRSNPAEAITHLSMIRSWRYQERVRYVYGRWVPKSARDIIFTSAHACLDWLMLCTASSVPCEALFVRPASQAGRSKARHNGTVDKMSDLNLILPPRSGHLKCTDLSDWSIPACALFIIDS